MNLNSPPALSDSLKTAPVSGLMPSALGTPLTVSGLSSPFAGRASSIAFIDVNVSDYQTLVAGVAPGTEVHVLDSRQDAVTQITNTLLGRHDISSLHIVSHGEAGGLDFGTGKLNLQNLPEYAAQVQSWSNALTENADLLLYGCDVAQGELGKAFTSILSQLTGADVAASDDLTGSADKGGDWTLEYQTGSIGSALAWQRQTLAHYSGVLAPTRLSNFSDMYFLTNVNGTVYFQAYDPTNGNELWKSDGTVAGTVLVKDINPGSNSSYPNNLTNVNGTLYFRAFDPTNGNELWKSDGTAAGTVLVKDIFAGGSNSSGPTSLTNVNGTLYFRAYEDTNGYELWKSDGTAAGTVLVKDINPGGLSAGVIGSEFSSPTNVNGTLYFGAYEDTNGYELWKSDGTAAGTVLVKDIFAGSNSSDPDSLTNVNGTLYFKARNTTNRYELWKSDGTAAGTVLVKDVFAGSNSSDLSNLTNVNGTLYFQATNSIGSELWKSDGTAAGTVLVKDINPGSGSSGPTSLTNVNGTLYFRAFDPTNGAELWKSDGTAAGTVLVKDINPLFSSGGGSLTNINGTLYFQANDGTNGDELWKSNGTAAGTVLVKDIFSGSNSSFPNNLVALDTSRLLFVANDGINGNGLWLEQVGVAPTLSIGNVSQREGTSGATAFTFAVSLSTASAQTVAVNYTTADGTATVADGDYSAATSSITFAPGETSKTITINVKGDPSRERDETFFVNLLTPTNATLDATANRGTGTILNDDHVNLLWRSNNPSTSSSRTGQNAIWQLNSFTLDSGYYLPTVADSNWQIVSTADFNNDGTDDLLWRNQATGQNAIWQLNSTGFQSGRYLTPVADLNWKIASTADFNNDGIADILWRNQASGQNAIWEMNSTGVQTGHFIPSITDLNWKIISTADFNNDGIADLLWRNQASGQNAIWEMKRDFTLQSGRFITPIADSNWQIVGTGDFNQDGTADLVWRNQSTGQNAIWQMNSTNVQIGYYLTSVADLNWQIAGIADFDGDGSPDLLWRNAKASKVGLWQMNGVTETQTYLLPDVSPDWVVRPLRAPQASASA
ncbi:MAG: DUF4347 domain-containing protein [Phormidesmis sp. CAN_BIN44]|nr:DUF4347 domain-containing protein [Phormidesmis sp. CAN_BIN44]